MIRVTIQRADGTTSVMLIRDTEIATIDQDNRLEAERKGANSVLTFREGGRKIWIRETVDEIANQL